MIVHTDDDTKQLARLLTPKSKEVFRSFINANAKMLRLPDVVGKTKEEIGRLVTCTLEDFVEKMIP